MRREGEEKEKKWWQEEEEWGCSLCLCAGRWEKVSVPHTTVSGSPHSHPPPPTRNGRQNTPLPPPAARLPSQPIACPSKVLGRNWTVLQKNVFALSSSLSRFSITGWGRENGLIFSQIWLNLPMDKLWFIFCVKAVCIFFWSLRLSIRLRRKLSLWHYHVCPWFQHFELYFIFIESELQAQSMQVQFSAFLTF